MGQKWRSQNQRDKKTLPQFGKVNGLTGKGWKDVVKKAWEGAKAVGKFAVKTILNTKPREGFSPSVRRLLEKHGGKNIKSITLFRQPINSFLSKVLNWVTLGTFQKNLEAAGYDNALHLYCVFTLEDGTMIRGDKDEVVKLIIVNSYPSGEKIESQQVSGVKPIALNDFLNKATDSVGKDRYFVYDSRNNNCQQWIMDNLTANGLSNSSIKSWVQQSAADIYKNLGLLGTVNKAITDVAAKVDTAIYGEGKRTSKNRKK